MIPINSRYNQGTVYRAPDVNGVYNTTVLRTVPPGTQPFIYYVWKSGDRPDLVAANQLGDPTLWWAIFDLNPEIVYPLDVPVGTWVRIPQTPIMGQGTTLQ